MACLIRRFWSKLEGSVHPEDQPVFDKYDGRHTFNLDYPPPAFIGHVDDAPVVLLMSNGGYGPETAAEFQTPNDYEAYRSWLACPNAPIPRRLSPYYSTNRLFPLVRAGKLVIVNAVAYRSPKLNDEPANRALARQLPSVAVHRQWLLDEVIPAAKRNERLLIVHRNGMWKIDRSVSSNTLSILFSTNSVSPHLSIEVERQMNRWLHCNAQSVRPRSCSSATSRQHG